MATKIFLLIAYDITANRRRNRLVKLLNAYGSRVNLSVFECRLGREDYAELRKKTSQVINPHHDSVLFYELCLNCQRRMMKIGCGSRSKEAAGVVVV